MPDSAVLDIDHLTCIVPSLQQAAADLDTLGFTVTPISIIEDLGLANCLVLMQPPTAGTANLIEMMQVVDAARVPKTMQPFVATHGPGWIVLSGPSAHQARGHFLRCGVEFPAPVSVHRQWVLPDGEVLELAFDVLLLMKGPVAFNYCCYHTLHHYLRPAFLTHANGAKRLAGILGQAADAREAVATCARLFGAGYHQEGTMWRTTPGRVALKVAEAEGDAGISLSGCEIAVSDLQLVTGRLRKSAFDHHVDPGAVAVRLRAVPHLEIRFVDSAVTSPREPLTAL